MAEVLDVNSMLANQYEPKRSFRWVMEVDGLDAFTFTAAQRPKGSFGGPVIIDWLNTKRYLPGKWSWDEIAITLNDPIAPSAAQKVMDWIRLCYEHQTGRAGYLAFYQKDIRLKLLDGPGAVVEQWLIQGAYVQGIGDMGALDYSSEEIVKIQFNIRYQNAILEF